MSFARTAGMPMLAPMVLAFVVFAQTSNVLAGVTPVGPAFTYQGHLKQSGTAYSGTADFQFRLFATSAGGTQIGSTQAMNNITVADGMFAANLNFGPLAFDGQERWLEIAVHAPANGGAGPFATLTPRQLLTAAPYAAFSLTAGSIDAANVSTGTLAPARLPTGGAWMLTSDLNIGSDTLVIDNDSGRVGIGVASPQAQLHIGGTPGVDGIQFADGSVQVSAAASAIRTAVNLNVASLPPLDSSTETISVPGATIGSSVSISPASADLPDFVVIAWARVSAADTVRVRFQNVHPSITVNPPSQDYGIAVFP
jgi:hypothetical protein